VNISLEENDGKKNNGYDHRFCAGHRGTHVDPVVYELKGVPQLRHERKSGTPRILRVVLQMKWQWADDQFPLTAPTYINGCFFYFGLT